MTAPLVILTNERDFAADDVIWRLKEKGVEILRLNIESCHRSSVPVWEIDNTGAPTVVWWRQFETEELPEDLPAIDDLLVSRAQWRTWISMFSTPNAIWVNDIWAARRAENKIEQLRVANAIGFHVPRTIVTNDQNAARAFREDVGDAVVKSLASAYFAFSDQSFVFTEMVDDVVLDEANLWSSSPVIVQESLIGSLDARIVAFGGRAYGALCTGKGSDWRKIPFEQDLWRSWDVPVGVSNRCHAYLKRFGLEYGAFDFMIRGDEPYFLEANQAGEWLFLDRALDLGISEGLADRFVELATNAC